MLLIEDVAGLLGPGIKPKTVSQYLSESRQEPRPDGTKRRYADHPFPAPDGRVGRAPWWRRERRAEILAWAAERPGQGAGGGRPRSVD